MVVEPIKLSMLLKLQKVVKWSQEPELRKESKTAGAKFTPLNIYS